MSEIADLKEFNGKDRDEDRARSWISKVKSHSYGIKTEMKINAECSEVSSHVPHGTGITS